MLSIISGQIFEVYKKYEIQVKIYCVLSHQTAKAVLRFCRNTAEFLSMTLYEAL